MPEPPPDAIPVRKASRNTAGLTAAWVDDDTFLVYGHGRPHFCYYNGDLGSCDCADFIWRDRVCKHLEAVRSRADA